MAAVETISTLDDPRAADFANLQDRQLLHAGIRRPDLPHGLFIAEGDLVVRQLLVSRFHVRAVLGTAARLEALAPELAALPDSVRILSVAPDLMNDIVGFNIHRGLLASAARAAPLRVEDLLARARAAVIAEDLTNHDNLGGLFRSVSALAPAGTPLLLSPRCTDPLYRKAIRVSMGQALQVPFATMEPWPRALSGLEERGFLPIALTPSADAVTLVEAAERVTQRGMKPALLVGSEGPGLSARALAACPVRARIPIRAGVDSLNVNVAAAVALAALVRPD